MSGKREIRGGWSLPSYVLPLTCYRSPLTAYLLLLVACHGSPQKQQEKLRQELKSWDATDQLTRELSQRGSLPRVYVRQVSDAVEQGKKQLQQRASQSKQ